MMWWNGGWSWWGWCLMGVTMLVFWALVAWVVVAVVRSSRTGGPGGPPAADILAERYARGEIDQDEYRRRLAALREASPTSHR